MADVRCLERTLGETLLWNKARIHFLAKFLISLIEVRTVNLVERANSFSGKAKQESNYKRRQRFLLYFELSYAVIAVFVVQLRGEPKAWILVMDRNDSQLGKKPLNILSLAIAYKGVAFPLLWKILPRQGSSDTAQRKAGMKEDIELFGVSSIAYLCADR
jgi:hypothetical protein